jgi:hypothetical protein
MSLSSWSLPAKKEGKQQAGGEEIAAQLWPWCAGTNFDWGPMWSWTLHQRLCVRHLIAKASAAAILCFTIAPAETGKGQVSNVRQGLIGVGSGTKIYLNLLACEFVLAVLRFELRT